MLVFLDLFFLIFHAALILFNLFGWMFRKTRRWNLVTLLLTGLSWTVLGIFYGFGYCPFTDWHFQVVEELGKPAMYSSYVPYFFDRLLGIRMSSATADILTLVAFLFSLACSFLLNLRARFVRQDRR